MNKKISGHVAPRVESRDVAGKVSGSSPVRDPIELYNEWLYSEDDPSSWCNSNRDYWIAGFNAGAKR